MNIITSGIYHSEDNKLYEVSKIDDCSERVLKLIKEVLPEDYHTYENYEEVLERCIRKLKVKNFKNL